MASDKITISFSCKGCGTTLTWSDNASDSTKISCSNCGKYAGTYGDLRKAGTEAARAKVEAALKKALKIK